MYSLAVCIVYSLIWQVFTDNLSNLWIDECRAHDPFVLQVIDSLGYKKIIADFGVAKPGTSLAAMVTTPPPSRLPITDAKDYWKSFWSAKISLIELMETLNTRSLALSLPERHQGANIKLLSFWLQRNLLELGSQGYFSQWKDVD